MTTRRNFLAANLIGAAGLAAGPTRMFSSAFAAGSSSNCLPEDHSDRDFWVDWPAYLTGEMNQARRKRFAELAEIDSVAKAQKRADMVRLKVWELIGGPPEKTPLNPQVTRTLDRGQYRIENVIFESFPKVYVTANLYLPASGTPPYPAILAPVGHSENGKAYHYYRYLYQNLARKGYVVLTYDPFGQGERLQYINPQTGRSLYGPTGEHSQAGRPLVLIGETFALYCAWDGVRGLDYLVSRPEVDGRRLGCTGQSGGGTMAMYMAALEPRLRAVVVSDGNSENVAGPCFDPPGATDDAEQNIVGSLPFGIDRGDLLLSFAPKPLLICYTTHDEGVTYSPVYEQSTQHIYKECQRMYELLGAKDHVGLYASHLPHSLDFFNRTQTYAWFNRWLDNPTAGTGEAPYDDFPEEWLNATSTGQVMTSLGGRSVVQLNADQAQKAMANQRPVTDEDLTALLAIPSQRTPLDSRTRWSNQRKEVIIEEFQFESEPGIRIPGWFVTPSSAKGRGPAILYLTEDGEDEVVGEPGSMDRVLASGHAVCAITLRGLGITLPRFPSGGPNYYDSSVHMAERFAWTCLVMGRSVIGQRVWDTLRAMDYLVSRPDVDASQIRVLGVGSAGLAATMAAFLDKRPRSVLVDRTLVSYASIMRSKEYSLKLAWFVPGILKKFDLPEIAAGISPRPYWILNGIGADGQVFQESSLPQTTAPSAPHVLVRPQGDAQESYLEWLKNT